MQSKQQEEKKEYTESNMYLAIFKQVVNTVFLGYFSYQNRQVIEFYKGEDMSVVQTYQKLGLTKLSYRIYDNLLDYYTGE